jgi:hypothetical protein
MSQGGASSVPHHDVAMIEQSTVLKDTRLSLKATHREETQSTPPSRTSLDLDRFNIHSAGADRTAKVECERPRSLLRSLAERTPFYPPVVGLVLGIWKCVSAMVTCAEKEGRRTVTPRRQDLLPLLVRACVRAVAAEHALARLRRLAHVLVACRCDAALVVGHRQVHDVADVTLEDLPHTLGAQACISLEQARHLVGPAHVGEELRKHRRVLEHHRGRLDRRRRRRPPGVAKYNAEGGWQQPVVFVL